MTLNLNWVVYVAAVALTLEYAHGSDGVIGFAAAISAGLMWAVLVMTAFALFAIVAMVQMINRSNLTNIKIKPATNTSSTINTLVTLFVIVLLFATGRFWLGGTFVSIYASVFLLGYYIKSLLREKLTAAGMTEELNALYGRK